MIATLNDNIILPLKNLKRHSWIVICIFMFLILSGVFSASASTDQAEKQQLEIEIINPPKKPIFEKVTYTFEFRVKDSQNNQESLTYFWRLDYKEKVSFSPETPVPLKVENLTVGMHKFQVWAEGGIVDSPDVVLFKVIPDLHPPDTKIITEVSSSIKRDYITFQFEGNDRQTPKEKLKYSWRIDLGKWSEFSTQTSVYLSNLADGAHSFEVKAKDESGNEDATPAKVFFEVAEQEPDTVIIDPLEIVESSDVMFRFSGTDPQTPTEKLQYSWRVDNLKWSPFSTETITNLTNLSNGMHQFDVKARDEDGNEDSSYAKAVFRVAVNIEFPITEITEKIFEPNGNSTFRFKGTDTQTPDKLQYVWWVDKWNDLDEWSPFLPETTTHETIVYLSNLPEGKYRFQVKAMDADNNSDPTPAGASFEIIIPKIPEATITNAPTELLRTSEYTFHFNAKNLQSLVQYSWRLDGREWSKFSPKPKASVTVMNLTNGVHLFQVKAKDAEGNEVPTPAEISFEVGMPPEVKIINVPDAPLRQSYFAFQFQAMNLRTPVEYSWRLDGGDWSEFSPKASVTVMNLTNGVHLFQVKAKDESGNESPTPAEASFEVRMPPVVRITNSPDAPLKQDYFTFQFQVTNSQIPVQYSWRLDGGDWSEFSSEANTRVENLTNGEHLFQVRSRDMDGNINPVPAEANFIVAIPAPPDTKIITELDAPIKFSSYTFEFASTSEQARYSWRLDGGEWIEYQTTPKVRIENLTNGRHTLEVRSMDEQDRVDATPAQIFFVVDEQAPQVSIDENFPKPIQTSTYTFNLRGKDPQGSPDKLKYSWQLDEGNPTLFSENQTAVVENLADGKHILRVRCKDPDGNISPEVVISFNVKVDVPIIKDLDEYLGILRDPQLTLTLKGQDLQTPSDQLKYSYQLDNEGWSAYSNESKILLHDLKQGERILSFKVRDTDGNESQTYTVNFSVNFPFYRKRLFWGVVGGIVSVGFFVLAINQINLYRKRLYALKTRYNPYTPGIPVMEENKFFGRKEFLREIVASIHNTNFIIMGDNRIGKTSVLYKLTYDLKNMKSREYLYLPFYIDISDIVEEDKMFDKLLVETRRQASEYDLEIDFDSILKKEDDNFYRFQFAIDNILKNIEKKGTGGRQIRLIFMLDECDILNDLERRVKARIRAIFAQRYAQNVSAILTGVSTILDPERTSPWWNPFKIKLMIPFTDGEARNLIEEPAGKIYHFKSEAIDIIISWSKKNPYLVQLLCHEAIDMAINDERLIITEDDIQTAILHSQKEKEGIRKAPTEEEIRKQIEKSLSVDLFS